MNKFTSLLLNVSKLLTFIVTFVASESLMANILVIGDVFEFKSGGNTLFCRVEKVSDDTKGEVSITGQLSSINFTETGNYYSADKEPQEELVIPAIVFDAKGKEYNVINIEKQAFSQCQKITKVEVNCKEIGLSAFRHCSNLKEIILGDNVTSLSHGAFAETAIKTINLNKVTQIENTLQPFSACYNLAEIIVPEENNAFVAVDNVLYTKDMNQLIAMPSSIDAATWTGFDYPLTKISSGAFINLKAENFTIPSSLGAEPELYLGAFAEATIDNLYINGEYIPTEAFYNCTIKKIHIGPNIKSFGNRCFLLKGVEDIYIYGRELPYITHNIWEDSFSLLLDSEARIHVIPGYDMPAKIYADTDKWDIFKNVIEDIVSIPSQIASATTVINSTQGQPRVPISINVSGQRITDEYRGVIIKEGKKIQKR